MKPKEEKWFSTFVEKTIPDLENKTVVITGTTSGTGYWATVACIRKGCSRVLLLNRPSDRVTSSMESLNKEKEECNSNTEIIAIDCDLASFESVRKAGEEIKQAVEEFGIDVLINNAGMEGSLKITEDGFLRGSQVNHLSHFLLTSILIESLKHAADEKGEARIVNHSSGMRFFYNFNEEHYKQMEKDAASKFKQRALYGCTKISNCLFSLELNKRLQESGIIAVTAEPGLSTTSLMLRNWKANIVSLVTQSASDGAMPLLLAAFGKDVKANDFYCPGGLINLSGKPVKVLNAGKPTWRFYKEKNIRNEKSATKLWELSESAIGETVLSE